MTGPQGMGPLSGAFAAAPTVTVTINQGATQSDPTTDSTIRFDVHFSVPVTGFGVSDVTLSGTAGATTIAVSGVGSDYIVTVSGMVTTGTVIATIPAGVAIAAGGGTNFASTSTDNTVTWMRSGTPVTIPYSGAYTTYVVPVGITKVQAELWGAQGMDVTAGGTPALAGRGGYLKSLHDVTPGETLRIYVGGIGLPNSSTAFEFGGGSRGGMSSSGGGGGGCTDIRRTPYAFVNRLAVAGAGGGAGAGFPNGHPNAIGGHGHGNGNGDAGQNADNGLIGGGGATPTAAGAAGQAGGTWGGIPEPGELGKGGLSGEYHGGGGGSGIYGGGGGPGHVGPGGGGGGSGGVLDGGYVLDSAKGNRAGNGVAIITPVGLAASMIPSFYDPFTTTFIPGWSSLTGVFVSGDQLYVGGGSGRFGVYGTDLNLNHWSQVDCIMTDTTHKRAEPAVRMDAATSSYYSGTAIIQGGGGAGSGTGWYISKRVGGSSVNMAFVEDVTLTTATKIIRLAVIDCGVGLGQMLCLYDMTSGSPVFKVAGCDTSVSPLMYRKAGVSCPIDPVTYSGGSTIGDNWYAGNFYPNDGSHEVPRVFGGWITKATSTIYLNEFQIGTSRVGIREGGSISVPWLCAAGGGGGAGAIGGPGGGGGIRYGTHILNSALTVIVGAGGNRGWTSSTTATNGQNSSIGTSGSLASCTGGGCGGGAGAGAGSTPGSGGCGGGVVGFGTGPGGTGISGEGFGAGAGDGGYWSSPAGGAAAAGANANGGPLPGGAGKQWPTASGGDNAYYGGGGGNSGYSGGPGGVGGIGGGGNGGTRQAPYYAQDGTPKTGGGGGGGGHNDAGASGSTVGGFGGSGVAKFRSVAVDWIPAAPLTVTINKAASQPDPANESPIIFEVVFSEVVSGFETGDVRLSASTTPGTLVGTVSGSGTTYTVTVTGMTGTGNVIASIDADKAVNTYGLGNLASTSTDNVVNLESMAFICTGAVQYFTVAPGFETLVVSAWGAQGAGSGASRGGYGGYVKATIPATAGTTYAVYVGCPGGIPTPGWSNGGNGGTANNQGSGGGGASYIVPVGLDLGVGITTNAPIVAGGGGGGSDANYNIGRGGGGGYPNGENAATGSAEGGSQTAGGAGGIGGGENGDVDGQGYGGDGQASGVVLAAEGGGGGGGWHGGGGSNNDVAAGGGGGGSTHWVSTATNVEHAPDVRTGGGRIEIIGSITPPELTVTINKASSQEDPTEDLTIVFDVVFSAPVTGFGTSDVTLSGTAGATTVGVSGTGSTYIVSVSGMTSSGSVIATIPAGVATDILSQTNHASTSVDNSVIYALPDVPTLKEKLLSYSPSSFWDLNGSPTPIDDQGSIGLDLTFAAAPTSTRVGPEGGVYPLLGNTATAYATSGASENYGTAYTTGLTVVYVVYVVETFSGHMWQKHKPGSTNSDLVSGFSAVNLFMAGTRASANSGANSCNQVAATTSGVWHIFEVYFPPGDTGPLLYKEGLLITGADIANFNPGVRGNNGNGKIVFGGDGAGQSDADGNYAICAMYLRELTSTERSDYRASAIAEGWI